MVFHCLNILSRIFSYDFLSSIYFEDVMQIQFAEMRVGEVK